MIYLADRRGYLAGSMVIYSLPAENQPADAGKRAIEEAIG